MPRMWRIFRDPTDRRKHGPGEVAGRIPAKLPASGSRVGENPLVGMRDAADAPQPDGEIERSLGPIESFRFAQRRRFDQDKGTQIDPVPSQVTRPPRKRTVPASFPYSGLEGLPGERFRVPSPLPDARKSNREIAGKFANQRGMAFDDHTLKATRADWRWRGNRPRESRADRKNCRCCKA